MLEMIDAKEMSAVKGRVWYPPRHHTLTVYKFCTTKACFACQVWPSAGHSVMIVEWVLPGITSHHGWLYR